MANANIFALQAIILLLEILRSEKENYQERVRDEIVFRHLGERSHKKEWWRRVEEQINQIESDIDKIREGIRSRWPYSGTDGPAYNDITPILKLKSPDRMNDLIQGFKIMHQRLEAEAAKPTPDKPAILPIVEPTAKPAAPDEPTDTLSGEAAGEQPAETETAVTLVEFMQIYCQKLFAKALLTSYKDRLLKAARRKHKPIKLPPRLDVGGARIKAKFDPIALKKIWPKLREHNPSLPPLKNNNE